VEREKEREKEREIYMLNMVIEFISLLLTMAALLVLFLFFKGMVRALAPFSYQVLQMLILSNNC
jgi:hypothetical protein